MASENGKIIAPQ